jgi:hypothetical protein
MNRTGATAFASAISGLLWGMLAFYLDVRPLPLAMLAGCGVGLFIGFAARPLRDVEWPATVMLSLVGLYVSVMLFAAITSAYIHLATGRSALLLPLVAINASLGSAWGLTVAFRGIHRIRFRVAPIIALNSRNVRLPSMLPHSTVPSQNEATFAPDGTGI